MHHSKVRAKRHMRARLQHGGCCPVQSTVMMQDRMIPRCNQPPAGPTLSRLVTTIGSLSSHAAVIFNAFTSSPLLMPLHQRLRLYCYRCRHLLCWSTSTT